MKNAVLGLLVILCLGSAMDTARADPRKARNALFVEAGGSGLFYSLNYDRLLTDNLSFRTGYSSVEGINCFPIMLDVLVGSGSHRLDLGLGPVVLAGEGEVFIGDVANGQYLLSGFAGYRYQAVGGGLFFRIGATPLILTGKDGGFAFWGGLSLGGTF